MAHVLGAVEQEQSPIARGTLTTPERRRRRVVRPSCQYPVALLVGAWGLLGLISGMAIMGFIPVLSQAVSHRRILEMLTLADAIAGSWPWLIVGSAILVVSGILLSFRFSQHMAGPLNRLEEALAARLKGEPAAPIRIRQDDECQALVASLNALLKETPTHLDG